MNSAPLPDIVSTSAGYLFTFVGRIVFIIGNPVYLGNGYFTVSSTTPYNYKIRPGRIACKLRINVTTAQSLTTRIQVLKNSEETPLLIDIPGTGTYENVTDLVNFNDGDTLDIQLIRISGGNITTVLTGSLLLL